MTGATPPGVPLRRRPQRIVAVAIAAWVMAWTVAGVAAGLQIRRLTEVSDSLVQSGRALDTAGSALQAVGRLPVVGERTERLGNEVRQTAGEIQAAGESSRETVHSVSLIVGAALVLLPIVPVVTMYAPARVSGARERGAVARALAEPDAHPRLEEFLAYRAVANLPYETLMATSGDPWGDLQRGSYRRLANAELTRLRLTGRR